MPPLLKPIIKRAKTLLRIPIPGDLMVQLFVKGAIDTPITLGIKCKTSRGPPEYVKLYPSLQPSQGDVVVDIPRPVRVALWGHNVDVALAYIEPLAVEEFQEGALKVVLENNARAKDAVRREFLVPLRTEPYPPAGQSCTFSSKPDVNEYLSESIMCVMDPVKRRKEENMGYMEREGKTWLLVE